MLRGVVFLFLACCAIAGYAAGQGSESDQCGDYQQAIPAYYTCIIKCYQFVMGFSDSTANFCTGKFKLTQASRINYNNGDVVNTLKCIAIKCKQFVPNDVCEDSSSGFGDSTDVNDISTASSTTAFEDGANPETSTSAPSEITVDDFTPSSAPRSTSESSETTPPPFFDAETTLSPHSTYNPLGYITPSPQTESKVPQSIDEDDSEECDEYEDDSNDGGINDDGVNKGPFSDAVATTGSHSEVTDAAFTSTDSNPYFVDEGCVSDAYPFDEGSASDGSANNGGDDSSASAASAESNGDGSSSSAASDSEGGDSLASAASSSSSSDDSSASAASASSGEGGSSASAASASSGEDGSSASAASASSGEDDSSASAASASSGEDESSASAASASSGEDDSSASADSDFDASATNQTIKSSSQLSQNISQPYVVTASTGSPDGSSFESPAGISNNDMTSNDQTLNNNFDIGNGNNYYAGSETGVVQDGSRNYAVSNTGVGNNNPQVFQNPNSIPFGSNFQKVSDNTQQGPVFGPQLRPANNPSPRQLYNYQQGQLLGPQQRPTLNLPPRPQYNPQQGLPYNSPQGLVYNPQQAQFNSQQGTVYNSPQGQVYNPQQGQGHNLQQGSMYNRLQNPANNNFANNGNYFQQNQWQRVPAQNNWNGNQNGAFPFNNQVNQRYRGNQGNMNYNRWQGNADGGVPSVNNGGTRGVPPNFVNN